MEEKPPRKGETVKITISPLGGNTCYLVYNIIIGFSLIKFSYRITQRILKEAETRENSTTIIKMLTLLIPTFLLQNYLKKK